MIILTVTKKQGFTLSLENTFFRKPQSLFMSLLTVCFSKFLER